MQPELNESNESRKCVIPQKEQQFAYGSCTIGAQFMTVSEIPTKFISLLVVSSSAISLWSVLPLLCRYKLQQQQQTAKKSKDTGRLKIYIHTYI